MMNNYIFYKSGTSWLHTKYFHSNSNSPLKLQKFRLSGSNSLGTNWNLSKFWCDMKFLAVGIHIVCYSKFLSCSRGHNSQEENRIMELVLHISTKWRDGDRIWSRCSMYYRTGEINLWNLSNILLSPIQYETPTIFHLDARSNCS